MQVSYCWSSFARMPLSEPIREIANVSPGVFHSFGIVLHAASGGFGNVRGTSATGIEIVIEEMVEARIRDGTATRTVALESNREVELTSCNDTSPFCDYTGVRPIWNGNRAFVRMRR